MKYRFFIYTAFSLLFTLGMIMSSCEKFGKKEDITKVEAAPEKGFCWPYYLYVPNSLKSATLLVLPNNSGFNSDNQVEHDKAAEQLAKSGVDYAEKLSSPILVPTFPRSQEIGWQVYTHALDRETLESTVTNLQRIDLQLIAMIDDAIERLSLEGIDIEKKVFIMGFSAAGMFANRFTVLHPERVKAAAIGSPGGWPIVPVEKWEGETLRYHVGVSDVQQLTGNQFNLGLFKTIPLFLFLGDQDTNDSVPYDDSYGTEDRELVNRLFGTTPVKRWPKAQQIYDYVGCSSQFVLYPGVGHEFSSGMKTDVINFFKDNR